MPGGLQGGVESTLLIEHRTAEMRDAKELGFKAGAGCGREILLGEKRGADLEMLAKNIRQALKDIYI